MSGGRSRQEDGRPPDGGVGGPDPRLRRQRRAVLAALLVGVVVMVVFDHWFTLLAGIVLMLGAVVAGTFLVAAPGGFLDHDAADVDGEHGDASGGSSSSAG